MAFLAGKSGFVQVGVAQWKLKSWRLRMPTDRIDTTNFQSGGFQENIAGVTRGNVVLRGHLDSGLMAMTSGTAYTVTLGMSGGYSFQVSVRVDIEIGTEVTEAGTVEITGDTTGPYTPTIT